MACEERTPCGRGDSQRFLVIALSVGVEDRRPANSGPFACPKKRDRRLEFEESGDQGGPSSRVTLSSGRLSRLHLVASPEAVEGLAGAGAPPSEPDGDSWGLYVRQFGGGRIVSPPELRNRALRLALEIAANDEAECMALEGELDRLELEWRDAEELAAISDELLVPDWVNKKIQAWKSGEEGAFDP